MTVTQDIFFGDYVPPIKTFLFEIYSSQGCPKKMSLMSMVLYKYQIIIALFCCFFGFFFAFFGHRYYRFSLFSKGFLLLFFFSVSCLDILIVNVYSSAKGKKFSGCNSKPNTIGSS